MTNGIYLFNLFFTFVSVIAFVASVWLFFRLKTGCGWIVRVSLIGGCILSLLASLLPWLAVVLTVSFIPSFIYHWLRPLILAPFVVGIIGFAACWCILILAREFGSIFKRSMTPPRLTLTFAALFVFVFMGYEIRNGFLDYRVLVHAQELSQYAPTGTDPKRLKEIYLEVAAGHDTRMFADMAMLLALNHNAPPELLNAIYKKTLNSSLNAHYRDRIYLSLTKNPNLPAELLQDLMFSLSEAKTLPANSGALTTIHGGNSFSPDTLSHLASYPDCEVRRAVISYPNISPNVLAGIVKTDPDMGVRHDARQRLDFLRGVNNMEKNAVPVVKTVMTQLPERIIMMDNSNQLRRIFDAVENRDNTAAVLASLASNCFITDDLARKLYEKAYLLKNYPRTSIMMALASNPQTPPDILNNLAAEKDLAILRALASNPNLPYVVMLKLVPFPDCKIRKEIICIPNTSTVLLKTLQKDKDESVALEANERATQEENYLHGCSETKKLNPSCQKYYSTSSPDVRMYPNTSEAKQPLVPTLPLLDKL